MATSKLFVPEMVDEMIRTLSLTRTATMLIA